MTLTIKIEVMTTSEVMKLHYEKIQRLIKNYLVSQAYEPYEYTVEIVEIKGEENTR